MGKIAFVFPGQGAQHPGMGKELHDAFPAAKRVFDQASQAVGYDMAALCFEGTEEQLKMTENTQPSILTVSVAIAKVLEAHGIVPDAVAGLSLGEYAALTVGGALAFEDALKLVIKRGQYMQEAVPVGEGTMAAILGLSDEAVEAACEKASEVGIVQPVNYNCPGQLVIAGQVKAVEQAVAHAKEAGAKKAILLPVSVPFHTVMLKGAGERLKGELEKVEIRPLNIPLVNNVHADYDGGPEEILDVLVEQVYHPVRWEASIRRLIEDGFDTFIEVGPGNSLSKFIKRIDKQVLKLNVEDLASLEKTLKALEVE